MCLQINKYRRHIFLVLFLLQDDNSGYDNRGFDRSSYRSEKAADKWISDHPTHTILIKGLPPHVDEKDVSSTKLNHNYLRQECVHTLYLSYCALLMHVCQTMSVCIILLDPC